MGPEETQCMFSLCSYSTKFLVCFTLLVLSVKLKDMYLEFLGLFKIVGGIKAIIK